MNTTVAGTGFAWILFASSIAAADAPDAEAIDAAVRELGADAIEAREAAFQRLLELGASSPDLAIARLSREIDDPEVARRCADLRTAIRRGAAWNAILVKTGNDRGFTANLDALLAASAGPSAVTALGGLRTAAHATGGAAIEEAFRDVCARLLAERLGSPGLQYAALENLVETGDLRAAACARKLAEDTSLNGASRREDEERVAFSELRALALETLARVEDPRAGDIAIERLKDPRELPVVRDAALNAIWNARDPRADEIVVAHFEDPDPELRLLALQFARTRPARSHAGPLRKAFEPLVKGAPASVFDRGTTGIATYALLTDMLGEAGDPAAAALLLESLEKLSAAASPDTGTVADLRARTAAALEKLAGQEDLRPASR